MKNITIIGTGAYGTSLAQVLNNDNKIIMYGIDNEEINNINNKNNKKYFSDIKLGNNIKATNNLKLALDKCEILIIAVPTLFFTDVCKMIANNLLHPVHFVNVTKGLNIDNGEILSLTITKVIKKDLILSNNFLTGPSIASEIIAGKLAMMTLSSNDLRIANYLKDSFSNNNFIVKVNGDIVGSQYAASLKNAIAIMSGIFSGQNAADSSIASVIAQGWYEIITLAILKGAKVETFVNVSTLGDLILTTSSKKSRNFELGYLIGNKNNAKIVLDQFKKTAEGFIVIKSIYEIIKNQFDLYPLFNGLYQILYQNGIPSKIINEMWR